ncbi:MAG: YjgP/YjgQ family permease [Bacteroidetes bacterium]|nr:YjgP/YjgQ family permease [Bacteroidota bacterium]
MSIIDRYIIKKFLGTYFFMLGIIMMFATVFDISEKLSDFMSNKAPVSGIIFEYYVNFIVYYGNLFSSMIIFLSVIWFTAKMAKDTEIVPILFSGKPVYRLYRPYMIAATVLMLFSLVLNHLIVPAANKRRLDFENQYYRNALIVEDYNAEYPGNVHVYFSNYMEKENFAHDFAIQKFDDQQKIKYFVKARYARNIPGTFQWRLEDYYEKTFDFPIGKINYGQFKDTSFNFQMGEMARRQNIAETMTYYELRELIDREVLKGSDLVPFYEIELHQRTSYPFATYVLTIIGLAVSSEKRRGGIGINIAIGLLFVFIYIFSMKMMTVASVNLGLPVLLAVWVPNFLFLGISILLFLRSQK